MKFNGQIWMRIPVTQKAKDEPDEFVIVKNPKFAGGLIPYARYKNEWTTTVPNRPLIRELLLLLDNRSKDFIEQLAEIIGGWNDAAADDDRGPGNDCICLSVFDDGSGRIGTCFGNPEDVNVQLQFDKPEEAAKYLDDQR